LFSNKLFNHRARLHRGQERLSVKFGILPNNADDSGFPKTWPHQRAVDAFMPDPDSE
jgi:hypothetical protein